MFFFERKFKSLIWSKIRQVKQEPVLELDASIKNPFLNKIKQFLCCKFCFTKKFYNKLGGRNWWGIESILFDILTKIQKIKVNGFIKKKKKKYWGFFGYIFDFFFFWSHSSYDSSYSLFNLKSSHYIPMISSMSWHPNRQIPHLTN